VREEEDDAAAAAFVVVVVAMLPTGGLLLALTLSLPASLSPLAISPSPYGRSTYLPPLARDSTLGTHLVFLRERER
jgi:hypothetical protein